MLRSGASLKDTDDLSVTSTLTVLDVESPQVGALVLSADGTVAVMVTSNDLAVPVNSLQSFALVQVTTMLAPLPAHYEHQTKFCWADDRTYSKVPLPQGRIQQDSNRGTSARRVVKHKQQAIFASCLLVNNT